MKRIYISIIAVLAACSLAFAVMLFVDGPNIITAQVSGLQMEQDGTDIDVTWNEMDCQGYDLVITCEGRKTTIPSLNEAYYVIRNAVPDKTYSVKVSARLDSGHDSRAAHSSLTAEKIGQDLELAVDDYNGLEKEVFNVGADENGELIYTSSDTEVADVDEDGNVVLKKPGHARIKVELAEFGVFEGAEKEIDVNVYPQKLATASLKMEEEKDSSVTFTWDKVKYAEGYKLLRYDASKEKYTKVKTFDDEKTSYNMARVAGKYKVQAFAAVDDRTIEGDTSKAVEIESRIDDMPAYSSLTTIKTIGSSDVDVVTYLTGNQSSKNPQSMCFTGDKYVVAFSNRSNTSGILEAYDTKGKQVANVGTGAISHANGCTYNKDTGDIYIMRTYAGHKIHSIAVFDGDTLKQEESISTNRAPSGIAYDESNDKYYMSAASRLYVTDGDMNLEKTLYRKRTHNSQDMGAFNGLALSCIWVGGSTSYIDMYRESDGAYVGSISVPLGEIESVVVNDGRFVILVNVIGSSRDAIYITKDRINLP